MKNKVYNIMSKGVKSIYIVSIYIVLEIYQLNT